jgi:hypothetical protein
MSIEVVEAYKNYAPPIDAVWVAQVLLKYVPLAGCGKTPFD